MQIRRTTYFGSRLILCRKLGLENRGKYVLVMFEIFFIRIKSPTHPTQEKWVRTNQPRPFLRLPTFFWPSCQALWQSQEAWKCVSKRGGRCLRLRTFFFSPFGFFIDKRSALKGRNNSQSILQSIVAVTFNWIRENYYTYLWVFQLQFTYSRIDWHAASSLAGDKALLELNIVLYF